MYNFDKLKRGCKNKQKNPTDGTKSAVAFLGFSPPLCFSFGLTHSTVMLCMGNLPLAFGMALRILLVSTGGNAAFVLLIKTCCPCTEDADDYCKYSYHRSAWRSRWSRCGDLKKVLRSITDCQWCKARAWSVQLQMCRDFQANFKYRAPSWQ